MEIKKICPVCQTGLAEIKWGDVYTGNAVSKLQRCYADVTIRSHMLKVLGMVHFCNEELRSSLRLIGQGTKDISWIQQEPWIPGCFREGKRCLTIEIPKAYKQTALPASLTKLEKSRSKLHPNTQLYIYKMFWIFISTSIKRYFPVMLHTVFSQK